MRLLNDYIPDLSCFFVSFVKFVTIILHLLFEMPQPLQNRQRQSCPGSVSCAIMIV